MGEAVVYSGGGLSAAELATETLFPGDTIEYFSMAFVAGDPRGHRVAKVLRVQRSDEDFPIRIDSQEMIPLTMMLKRKRDRLDHEIPSSDAKWRKLRTFRLVDGEVEGETCAQRLNAGLKKAVSDAYAAVRKQLAADNAQAKSRQLMQNFFKPTAPKEKENNHISGSDDDDFELSPSSREQIHIVDRPHRPRPVKRVPLATAEDTELNIRSPGREARSAERNMDAKKKKKKRKLQQLQQQRDRVHQHRNISSTSPRPAHRERGGNKLMKRQRLNFTNGPSSERLLSETTAADDNDDDSGDDVSASLSRISSPHRLPRHATPEMKKRKKHKIQMQKYVNQIQEKKSSASLDEYMKLDKKEQALMKVMEREGWATSLTPSSSSGPSKTLQLNKNAVDAHRWQESRKQFRNTQAKSSTGITSWLQSKNESVHASPSPSKKRREKGAKKATPEGAQERRALTAPEFLRSEVFGESDLRQTKEHSGGQETKDKSLTKGVNIKHRRSEGSQSSVGRENSRDGKRAKMAPVGFASSSLMNKWVQRIKGNTHEA